MGWREIDHQKPDVRGNYSRNLIREEIDRMEWRDVIDDEEADRDREFSRLEDRMFFWRSTAVMLIFGFVVVFILILPGDV